MYQEIDDKLMEVVEFDTMPELPITGLTDSEKAYRMGLFGASYPHGYSATLVRLGFNITHAEALTDAIKTGVITEPGKYGVELHQPTTSYTIHKIIEP